MEKKQRNSSIELLRILAVYMITTRHMVSLNSAVSETIMHASISFTKIVLLAIHYSFGKAAVVAFIAITVWFLSEECQFSKSLQRVWMLEREVLFYSIVLTVSCVMYNPEVLTVKNTVRAVFPLIEPILWQQWLPVEQLYRSPYALLGTFVIATGGVLVCLLVDLLRRALFAITIDKHKGRLFRYCYAYVKRHVVERAHDPV